MAQLLRTCGTLACNTSQQCIPQLSLLAPMISDFGPVAAAQGQLLGSSGSHQLQQQRGAAAKKKAPAGKGAKKGQQQPAKKSKQKMDSKPFDEKDPLMQKLVAMLVPAKEPQKLTPLQQQAARDAFSAFRQQHNRQHAVWAADMREKLALKAAALKALPPDLRKAASEEDHTPFPLTRHFLYDSPPDSYKK